MKFHTGFKLDILGVGYFNFSKTNGKNKKVGRGYFPTVTSYIVLNRSPLKHHLCAEFVSTSMIVDG